MSYAAISGREIVLQSSFAYRDECKSIPGAKWDAANKVWKYQATPATAFIMAKTIDDLSGSEEFWDLYIHWVKLRDGNLPESLWPATIDREPWEHQRNAFSFIENALGKKTGSAGLFAGMGTGKTLTTIAVMARRRWKNVLIVCPKNMIHTWEDEINARIVSNHYTTYPITGTKAAGAKTLRGMAESDGGRVVIVNYQKVWSGELGEAVLDIEWDAVILDEAQAIKSAGSKVSLFFHTLSKRVPFRIALTGTPLHDKPTDVYGVYRFLDSGIFGTSFQRFKDEYTIQRAIRTGIMVVVGFRNLDNLSRSMYQNAFRVSEDVLDLPSAVDSTRVVDMPKKTRKVYNDVETDFVSDVGSGTIVAGNILTQLLRLQQIAAGHVTTQNPDAPEETAKTVRLDTEKADALSELLDEVPNEPVVVFAKFREDLKAIRDVVTKLDRPYFEESGTSHEWRDFQRSARPDAVIGVQIDAGSAGIDLTRSAYAVYYTVGYSLGNYEQSRRRLLRPGQTRSVRYVHLVTAGTVDGVILNALKTKKDISTYVVDTIIEGH